MMVIEKLNNKNSKYFNLLLKEAEEKSKYRVDFYKNYDNKTFVYKYFLRKLVSLVKFNDKYIGYIWIDIPSNKTVQIQDMYIQKEYIQYLNEKTLLIFKSDIVLYEGLEDLNLLTLVRTFKMNRIRLTYLMKLNNEKVTTKRLSDAKFIPLIKNKDEKLRCNIQNDIFKEDTRTPLTLEDIKYDEKQEYYIDDLCVFIKVKNTIIGYGQIIFNRGIYSVVNFGIIDKFRSKGYGEDLIIKLIDLAREKGIKDLYIRVDNNNIPAKKLYRSVGFEEVGQFSTWLWAKELI